MSEVFLRCARRDGKAMTAFLPWAVEEAALAATGERLHARFSRQGELLITAKTPEEAAGLLSITQIGGIAVDMVRPVHLNRSQGSIYAPDLLSHPTDDLLPGFASQGVTAIFRPRNSPILILTFDQRSPPEHVQAAFLRFPVRPVVPLPRRCTRCQRYGHKVGRCHAPLEICGMCGGEGHAEPFCAATTATCAACGGPHAAREPICPVWVFERSVQRLISEGWTPGDARRRATEEWGEAPLDPPPPPARAPRPRLGPGSLTHLGAYPPLPTPPSEGPGAGRPPRPARPGLLPHPGRPPLIRGDAPLLTQAPAPARPLSASQPAPRETRSSRAPQLEPPRPRDPGAAPGPAPPAAQPPPDQPPPPGVAPPASAATQPPASGPQGRPARPSLTRGPSSPPPDRLPGSSGHPGSTSHGLPGSQPPSSGG